VLVVDWYLLNDGNDDENYSDFMNYLRGAVSAISAPYQYYKDINPSTLTGAIDVIVISRPKLIPSKTSPDEQIPAADGETEFVCSPFHVRFGKWQVLRPADKKVRR
jgi:phosphatidate phosphatase LPIN